jgi:integrase/recombinase XerD
MKSAPRKVRVSGPLAPFAEGFGGELAARGYSPLSAASLLYVMAHLSRWLAGQGLAPADLGEGRAEEFLAERRRVGSTCWLSGRGLAPLLGYLRGLGVVPGPAGPAVGTGADVLLGRYRDYLAGERGLAASTIDGYEAVARRFLAGRAAPDLAGVNVAEVTGFVVAQCRGRGTGSAKILVTALRSLLRYLHLEGITSGGLASAVPAVAGWRGAGLPKALAAAQVAALLGSCDRDTAVGRRDFAVLTLLARLGLRACEVAALELGDVDWRAGELLVRGKGRRGERMPLPADVGEAVAGYLSDGRPRGQCRKVFAWSRAPYGDLTPSGVKSVVRRACDRAGLPQVGAHRLRHTAATQMLRAGSPLAEVGQVLRHRAAATTAIYAKVDDGALRTLARPWPGSGA